MYIMIHLVKMTYLFRVISSKYDSFWLRKVCFNFSKDSFESLNTEITEGIKRNGNDFSNDSFLSLSVTLLCIFSRIKI